MVEKCIVILAGTIEIHQPLYRLFLKTICHPVHLIPSTDLHLLETELNALLEHREVWIFPSNEITLNNLYTIISTGRIKAVERLKVPGTAIVNQNQELTAQQISNKSLLFSILKDREFKNLQKVRTQLLQINKNFELNHYIDQISFPIIIKPAQKDKMDSFTQYFPSKILMVETASEFVKIFDFLANQFLDCQFLVQQIIPGITISWGGYIYQGEFWGYQVTSLIKSPSAQYGGTTTLAEIKECDDKLGQAINELAQILKLDGVFEIELIAQDNQYYFFYEINPRPWLQVALLLQQEYNIFLQYLSKNGFSIREHSSTNQVKVQKQWGSAIRYLELNEKQNTKISLKIILMILKAEIYYSQFFSYKQKIQYTFYLLKYLLKMLAQGKLESLVKSESSYIYK